MIGLSEIRERLADRNLREVSRQSGLHYNVVYRLANGTENPSFRTVRLLAEYLEARP